ncbi:DUF3102 domain-containing protein [Methylosinus trichosporium OB3b]|uniref:DUF3102 domain-containing protein n=2 Tax=Methylocystaceae TaxID=31993 RepID=A0A2D2CYV2_METT3|nr:MULTISPECIES: DUF3102 domain-containing protein [Methylosinus]ATQ67910.1 DUF3102 domain-containing protein [Methylosinus trichosporium OB3b]OBS54015.1 hypothetical protein A8B73_02875 [Methylosinus sp. 3S-1]
MARQVEPAAGDVIGFAYEALDGRKATALKEAAARIRRLHAESLKSCIEIGRTLAKAKRSLPHGGWTEWLEVELGLNDRTAQNYMRVAEVMKGKTADVGDLSPSLLLEIVSSKAPEFARDEILGRVRSGEAVTVREGRKVIASAKGTAGAPVGTRTLPTHGAAPAAALPSPASLIAAPAVPVQDERSQQAVVALQQPAVAPVQVAAPPDVEALAAALYQALVEKSRRQDEEDEVSPEFIEGVYSRLAERDLRPLVLALKNVVEREIIAAIDEASPRRAPPPTAPAVPAALLEKSERISDRRPGEARIHADRRKLSGAFTALAEAERRSGMTGARVDPAALVGRKPQREPLPGDDDFEPPQPKRVPFGREFDD